MTMSHSLRRATARIEVLDKLRLPGDLK